MAKRWKRKYEAAYNDAAVDQRIWSIVSDRGGVHLWCSSSSLMDGRLYGGVEFHYRVSPDDNLPHNDHCWLLNGPCWHDGSSLLADEMFIPVIEVDPNNHVGIFRRLEMYGNEKFYHLEEDDDE